ncbi:MAG: alanine racemase [Rhodospirillales bacterium]|nr:alanine racemase [Rhodospirillales bacterium]
MNLADLQTPSLILDRGILARNATAMTARARELGVKLRPHMKTAKSMDVARMAIDGNFGGITVSTLAEAEYFFSRGLRDIVYAVGITPNKLDRAGALIRQGCSLTLMTDDAAIAAAITEKGRAMGLTIAVLIEIDCGEHRAGLAPGSDELLAIAKILNDGPGTALKGVLTHAGHSYACRTVDEMAAVAEDERLSAALAGVRLHAAGLPVPIVSVGSTPTALHAKTLKGVSELRAGVYMFGDLFQAGIGSCRREDIAVSVLASVTGHRPDSGTLLIDAGALALSKDRSTESLKQDMGFGLVVDENGRDAFDGLIVNRVYQEHGLIEGADEAAFAALPIGARVRILPNHSCLTAAMYDEYHVVDGGTEVTARWPRANGW